MKIYVVQGSTGEYSDHREWLVCAFKEEQQAKNFVVQLTQEANTMLAKYKHRYDWKCGKSGRMFDRELPPNDHFFDCDYTGFNYTYCDVELKD